MESSIIIDRLRKVYHHGTRFSPGEDTVALDLQDRIEIPHGELFGLIGPDGAGKTTLFRILSTLILADSGSATIEGFDVVKDYKELRKITGYMPGRFSLYPDLSVRENLEFYANVFGADIQKNYPMIEDIYCRLEPFEKRRAEKLSGGMKQKLALCCALIHCPKLLYLDEPTTGVDPSSRREFWESLARLKEEGMTMIVSTAYMDEATRCDRVAMMKEGRFLTVGKPQDIIDSYEGILLSVRSDDMFRLLNDVRQIDAVASCYTFGDAHHVLMKRREDGEADGVSSVEEAEGLLAKALTERFGHANVFVSPCTATMEDCYMYLAGRKSA